MARCIFTGKRALKGHNVSHANNKTRKWQLPNIQKKRIWVEELNKFVRIPVSTRALRSITKMGLLTYAKKKGVSLESLLS